VEGRRGVVCKQLQEAQGRVTLSSLPAASPPRTSMMHLRGSASEEVHPKVASRRHVAGGLGRFSGAWWMGRQGRGCGAARRIPPKGEKATGDEWGRTLKKGMASRWRDVVMREGKGCSQSSHDVSVPCRPIFSTSHARSAWVEFGHCRADAKPEGPDAWKTWGAG